MYKIVKSLFHVALIAVCVGVPFSASAGVGTDANAMTPSDLTSSTMPLMTAPSTSGMDTQAAMMPLSAVPAPELQNSADSRAIAPSYPAPSFKADMLLAQGTDPYATTASPSYMDSSNMMYPQQYQQQYPTQQYSTQQPYVNQQQYTTPQYPVPPTMGQYPQYDGSMMTVPPYPYQGNQQQPYMQQGMTPQMPGMGMPQYGTQQQYMSVEQLYNQAMQSYRSRDFQNAMMGFQQVAMQFPQSDLADNAYYWIGEIYYSAKNYSAAIQSFQTVLQMYPQGNKVPDAMVKMGFAYADIGQSNTARAILNDVSMRFSNNARIRNLAVKKLNALNNLY